MSRLNRLYPHLLPESIAVWQRFLKHHEHEYSRFDYDVRIGRGRDPGPNIQPPYRKMAVDLSKRRIDAVGVKHNEIHIIEITPSAGIHALGQLQTYPILFVKTFMPTKPVTALLVCAELGPDVQPALDHLGIKYLIFPEGDL